MDRFEIPPPRPPSDGAPGAEGGEWSPNQVRCGMGLETFAGTYEQVSRIREWCRCLLEDAGMPGTETAQLVVGELASNAIRHSASGERMGTLAVKVQYYCDLFVLLTVTDEGPRVGQPFTRPQVGNIDPLGAESGRGLLLVDAVALEWGWGVGEGGAVTVRAFLDPLKGLDPLVADPRQFGPLEEH